MENQEGKKVEEVSEVAEKPVKAEEVKKPEPETKEEAGQVIVDEVKQV